MKRLFVCVVVMLVVFSCLVCSAAALDDSAFAEVRVDFPEGAQLNWSDRSKLILRYADDKMPIPFSQYYDSMVFATIPRENLGRELEVFLSDDITFTDDDGFSYEFYNMEILAEIGVLKGDEQDRALPYNEITRAEAAAMILRLMGIAEDNDAKITFNDVADDSWYRGVVGAASKYGIVNGDTPECFNPERSVSREEFSVMLARALWRATNAYENGMLDKLDRTLKIGDKEDISDWAIDAYYYFRSISIFDYVETGVIAQDGIYETSAMAYPVKNTLRHEAAELIERARTYYTVYPSRAAIEFGLDKEMPVIDGSTSTYPFTEAVYANLFSNGWEHPMRPQSHSKSHASYQRLINGEVDMIFASVYPASDILELAKSKGVEIELIPIAYDAMIFFTNAENDIKGLTTEQITEIYVNNTYKNWSELGGSDAAVYPYCRNNDSGSHAQMERHFLKDKEINEAIRRETTSMAMADILTDVVASKTADPLCYGLGYSIYYYYHNAGMVLGTENQLKLLEIDGVMPNDETIADGSYPLSNNTYIALRKDTPEDAPARRMAEFMLTEKGQECVAQAGFGKLIK